MSFHFIRRGNRMTVRFCPEWFNSSNAFRIFGVVGFPVEVTEEVQEDYYITDEEERQSFGELAVYGDYED